MEFLNNKELIDWLEPLLDKIAYEFEKEFNVTLANFKEVTYQNLYPLEHRLFKLILMVFDKLQRHHTNLALVTVGKRSNEIWVSLTFQMLAKKILEASVFKRKTKDSKPDRSEENLAKLSYILNCPPNNWSTPKFKEVFYEIVGKTKLSIKGKARSAEKELEYKKWWIATQCLISSGTGITEALEIVAEKFNKSEIKKNYLKVNISAWAKGAGVLQVDSVMLRLNYKRKEINIESIYEELTEQSAV